MIGANMAALQVAVPLIGAPLCTLIGRGKLAWMFAAVAHRGVCDDVIAAP